MLNEDEGSALVLIDNDQDILTQYCKLLRREGVVVVVCRGRSHFVVDPVNFKLLPGFPRFETTVE